jgi:hypothetical protein
MVWRPGQPPGVGDPLATPGAPVVEVVPGSSVWLVVPGPSEGGCPPVLPPVEPGVDLPGDVSTGDVVTGGPENHDASMASTVQVPGVVDDVNR